MIVKSIFILLSLWTALKITAQEEILLPNDNTHLSSRIRWVEMYPDPNYVKESSIWTRIGEFFLGKKEKATLHKPISLIADSKGNYKILDQGIGKIMFVENNVGEMPHLFNKSLHSLVGICDFGERNFLFTDSRENVVFLVSKSSGELTFFADSVPLAQPTGIAYNKVAHEVWIVETAKHRIAVFDENGNIKRYIGKRGIEPGEFNFPTFIWIDRDGTVYIVDSMNFRIQILDNNGKVINTFGEIGDATGNFARPKGIATDSQGNIYVVDALFNAVQIFDKDGNLLDHFGRQGRGEEQFWMPLGIYIDNEDYIYVADSYNSRIQVFQFIKGE